MIRVEFDDARELADLWAIKRDLAFVAAAADRLVDLIPPEGEELGDVDGVVLQALQAAALVAYARCFASGKRFGLTEDTLDRGPEGAREYHRYLKDMRDKHIAHSVNPFEQTTIGVVLSADALTVEGVAHFDMQHIAFDKTGAKQLARYARQLSTVLNPEGKRLIEAVQAKASAELEDLKQGAGDMQLYPPGPDHAGTAR